MLGQRAKGLSYAVRLAWAPALIAGALWGLAAAPAQATPVATNDTTYTALGRVFPDPLANCQLLGTDPCSPTAQGNVPALQFIQIGEFLDALEYMNSKPDWQRYMEVLVLDGKLGANAAGQAVPEPDLEVGDVPGDAMFPGNTRPLEFDPHPESLSAGLPNTTLGRTKSDLITVRVTDETVPDAGKERYALSLSIHGIERAGLEGGTRAAEDLITAITTDRLEDPIVPESVRPSAPTFEEVLQDTIIYFSYPNPDGWRRGSVTEGGLFFQRYNGNGVDLNRDWPDIGFSFRPYSGLSEPESIAFSDYFSGIEGATGDEFAAGDDLHGQPFADALSYTLLPHGSHDFGKNERIRDTAIEIHRASEEAVLWSPIVQANDAPPGGGLPCAPDTPVGTVCSQIYGQTWGTVYDTINYTTTGALGDWFDSSIGLGADGIDNEMSFSHLDKNIVFDPHTEQLHVDGNKALIYAHLATILDPVERAFDPGGTGGYVPNVRVEREEKQIQADPPPSTVAQADISQVGTPATNGNIVFPFTVKRGPQPADGSPDAGNDVYNGGMKVNIATQNVGGIGTGIAHVSIQCRECDEHPGVPDDDPEWVTVAENYNQSPLYLQSGFTVDVNFPQALKADGTPIEWRAVLDGDVLGVINAPNPGTLVSAMDIDFMQGKATIDGATGGDDPPFLAGYDVANTDFFGDLNGFIEDPAERLGQVDPAAVIDGTQSLTDLRSLVLADDALPGYTGSFVAAAPGGGPTADIPITAAGNTVPGAGSRLPGTYEDFPFAIGANEANSSVTARIDWASTSDDFDLYLYRDDGGGTLTEVASSAQGGTDFEEATLADPGPGSYVLRIDNFSAVNPAFTGSITFEPVTGGGGGTGTYTEAEKDAWVAALDDYVRAGGNLVLTDGALEVLPALTTIPSSAVGRQSVYVGQSTFDLSATDGDETLGHPLARDIAQEGSRFNSGNRLQTFEPTPLGFAIQNQATGADESNARQFDVDRAAWEAAGGTIAATSTDSGERDAAPVYSRVTVGELPLGSGHIRIAGALLPQPSEEFDHTLGLEPYAVTYTGYTLVCNLLDCTVRDASPTGSGNPPTGDPPTGDPPTGDPPTGDPPTGGGGDSRKCLGRTVTIRGTAKRDLLRGTAGADVIRGRGGNDVINGGRGRDLICSGSGNDVARGGPGKDLIRGGPGKDTCTGPRDELRSCN